MGESYRPIENAELAPDKPITTNLLARLRDNLIGMGRGVAGAPNVDDSAINVNQIDGLKIKDETLSGDKIDGTLGSALTNGRIQDEAVGLTELKTATESFQVQPLPAIPALNDQLFLTQNVNHLIGWKSNQSQYSDPNLDQSGVLGYRIDFGTGEAAGSLLKSTNTFPGTMGNVWLRADPGTAQLEITYISSSPPWNLGNGDIPLFFWFKENSKTGAKAFAWCQDPPWKGKIKDSILYYKAEKHPDSNIKYKKNFKPNDIKAALEYRENKAIRDAAKPIYTRMVKRQLLPENRNLADPAVREAYLDALRNPEFEHIELTHELKNANMDLFPHPFGINEADSADENIFLIDPVSAIGDELSEIAKSGESIADLLLHGYLELGDEIEDINKPNGVIPRKARWKNTRQKKQ